MDPLDQTASLMTPAKLAQMSAAKPAATPAAFLNQMAADVGYQHLARLKELQPLLGEQALGLRAASLQPALDNLQRALEAVDFAPLQQKKGFLAGLTGKSKSAGVEFASQVERAETAVKALGSALTAVADAQRPHAAAAERTMVECEVEFRALDRVIEQGARWLQDMRNQLKARQAQANGDAEALRKVQEDAALCELLVARLKALRAAVAASQHAHQQAQAATQRRTGLAQALQKVIATEARAWRSAVPNLARFAAEGRTSGNVEDVQDVHAELRKRVGQLLTDAAQLRTDEEALGQAIAAMGERLAATAGQLS